MHVEEDEEEAQEEEAVDGVFEVLFSPLDITSSGCAYIVPS